MIRGYICDNAECEYTFEVEQKRDDPLKKKCPVCKKFSLYQDLSGIYVGVREVKSVGQLAERNTKALGRYGLEDRLEKEKQEDRKQYNRKKSIIEQKYGAVVPDYDAKDPIPPTPDNVKKSIASQPDEKSKRERQIKYIMEGK